MFDGFKTREFRFAELFSCARFIYSDSLKLLAVISAVAYLPISLLINILPSPYDGISDLGTEVLDMAAIASQPQIVFDLLKYTAVLSLIFIIFLPISTAAITHIVKSYLEGSKPTLQGALDASVLKWHKISITYFLVLLILGVGVFFIIVPIIFSVYFAFSVNVAADEGVWGFKALTRSMALVRRRWLKTGIFLLFLGITSFSVAIVFSSIPIEGLGPLAMPAQVLISLTAQLINSFFSVLSALWYFNKKFISSN